MALLTSAAIKGYRDYTMRRIAYAKFKVGSTEYKTNIESVKVTDSGRWRLRSRLSLLPDPGRYPRLVYMTPTISFGFPRRKIYRWIPWRRAFIMSYSSILQKCHNAERR